MKKIFFAGFLALALLASAPVPAWAIYKDEIAVSHDEVWKSIGGLLGKKSIRKSDPKKGTLESRWFYDVIRRSGSLPVLEQLSHQQYNRRYRYKISLKDRSGDTVVEIRCIYQIRNINANAAGAWHLIKPSADDLDIERDFFMKILKKIGDTRKAAPPA